MPNVILKISKKIE